MIIVEKFLQPCEKIECVGLVPALWSWIVNHPQFKEYDLSSLRAVGTG